MPSSFAYGAFLPGLRVIANPLQLTGLDLPPQLVLMVRLLALALLVTNPGAPAVVAAVGLLFSQYPRLFAALAGVALLLGSFRSSFSFDGPIVVGLLFTLIALSRATAPPRFLQWTVGLVYLGAALSQGFDPGWRSGWALIVLELALAVLAMVPRLHSWFIWGSGLLQCGVALLHGGAFDLTFYGMQAALFAFARWPEPTITVIWDGSCGFCRRTKELVERIDFDPVMTWAPLQSSIGERYGLTRAQLRAALHAAGPGWLLSGYSALRRMILYLPLFAYILFAVLALAPGPITRNAAVCAVLLFLSPVSNPIGDAVYGWIARHRHELLASETCELPDQS